MEMDWDPRADIRDRFGRRLTVASSSKSGDLDVKADGKTVLVLHCRAARMLSTVLRMRANAAAIDEALSPPE